MLRRLTTAMVMAFLAVLVAAGCSSADEPLTATTTVLGSTVADATTSTVAATTTSESPATTESTPDAAWTPEELEVIEAYQAYQDAWALATVDWDQGIEALGATMGGEYRDELQQLFAGYRDDGFSVRGSRSYEVQSVDFPADDEAVLEECGLGGFELLDDTGDVVSQADAERSLVSVSFDLEEGRWLVVGFNLRSSC